MEAAHHSTPTPALPPGEWRPKFAAEAGCEICSIAIALQRDTFAVEPELLRGMSIRLEDLSGVVLSCLTDEGATEDDVAGRLFGPEFRRQRPHATA